jgi:hypothetical protein
VRLSYIVRACLKKRGKKKPEPEIGWGEEGFRKKEQKCDCFFDILRDQCGRRERDIEAECMMGPRGLDRGLYQTLC